MTMRVWIACWCSSPPEHPQCSGGRPWSLTAGAPVQGAAEPSKFRKISPWIDDPNPFSELPARARHQLPVGVSSSACMPCGTPPMPQFAPSQMLTDWLALEAVRPYVQAPPTRTAALGARPARPAGRPLAPIGTSPRTMPTKPRRSQGNCQVCGTKVSIIGAVTS